MSKSNGLGSTIKLIVGDNRDTLRQLPSQSVQCVVTSPPYFNLRDYGTAEWLGGDPNCDHWDSKGGTGDQSRKQLTNWGAVDFQARAVCKKCGAVRIDNQIGMEKTPQEYVNHLVKVFREVRRVLRDDGIVWLNLGDSYAGSGKGGNVGYADAKQNTNKGSQTVRGRYTHPTAKAEDERFRGRGYWSEHEGGLGDRYTSQQNQSEVQAHNRGANIPGVRNPRYEGIKSKDLIGIPWLVAFALREDGWFLRQGIVWSKPYPMPESIMDRCTVSHEFIFLLAKSGKPTIWRAADTGEWSHKPDHRQRLPTRKYVKRWLGDMEQRGIAPAEDVPRWQGFSYYFDQEAIREPVKPNAPRRRKFEPGEFGDKEAVQIGAGSAPAAGERFRKHLGTKVQNAYEFDEAKGGNRRSVWKSQDDETGEPWFDTVWEMGVKALNMRAAAGAEHADHYAVWPEQLARRMILAGSPPGATVLDPFAGSGTTGLAAFNLGRSSILLELNQRYADAAFARLQNALPLQRDAITMTTADNGQHDEHPREVGGSDNPAQPREVGSGERAPSGS